MDTQCVVVGIGNPYLQDDRAGVVVIERLEQDRKSTRLNSSHT